VAQEHKQSHGTNGEEQESESASRPKDEELASEVDALLDEIDDVLEENAEEFVAGYVQRGGQ
jgi:ubiquitin-like protein Pup